MIRRSASIVFMLAACAGEPTSGPAPENLPVATDPAGLEPIAWLAGSWTTSAGGDRTEELWTAPAGGTMLGVGRQLQGGRTRFFEFLRIVAREDGVFYVASPAGRTPTEFRLVDHRPGYARFENPEHDFPTTIEYRRRADGGVTARVSGTRDGEPHGFELEFRPVAR